MSFFYMMDDLRYPFFSSFFLFSFFFFFCGGGGWSSSRWLFGTQLGLVSRSEVGGRAEARARRAVFAMALQSHPQQTPPAWPFS